MNGDALIGPGFGRLLCAVDVGPGTAEAVHQAISLCAGGASLRFAACRHDAGRDPSLPRDLTEMQARGALAMAVAPARAAGLEPSVSLLRGRPGEELLLAEAEAYDLLVLAGRTWPGREPARIDPLPLRIATRAPCSVLLTRPGSCAATGRPRVQLVGQRRGGTLLAERVATAAGEDTASLLVLRAAADTPEPAVREAVMATV